MAKDRTEAQTLADFLCKRKGQVQKIPTPDGYWNSQEWKEEYKKNIIAANSFLKLYSYTVIMNVLNSKAFKNIYSLRFPGLMKALEEEEGKLKRQQAMEEFKMAKVEKKEVDNTPVSAPKISNKNKSLKNRLDG